MDETSLDVHCVMCGGAMTLHFLEPLAGEADRPPFPQRWRCVYCLELNEGHFPVRVFGVTRVATSLGQ